MVQNTSEQITKVFKVEHVAAGATINQQPDFYECPICFVFPEGGQILECLHCKSRACQDCLSAYTKNSAGPGLFTCTVCHKEKVKMTKPNKWMLKLLYKVLLFDCQKCARYWSYDEFPKHAQMGNCVKHPDAKNLSQQLKVIAENAKQMESEARKAGKEDSKRIKEQGEQNKPTDVMQKHGLSSLYVFQRDTKDIIELDMQTGGLHRRSCNLHKKFEHNFQAVQSPSNRIFLIGGGDINKNSASLKECYEIFNNDTALFDVIPKDNLKSPRHGHAIACVKDKFLIVTGSRVDLNDANSAAEQYNMDLDIWFDLPRINNGRHYHATCQLANRFVYIFSGISNATKKYCNSIERLDVDNAKQGWEVIQFSEAQFPSRQGAGAAAINNHQIIIFGGFSGEFRQDVFILDHGSKQIQPTQPLPNRVFAYQMPTVFDQTSQKVFSVDSQSKQIVQYKIDSQQWSVVKGFRQV